MPARAWSWDWPMTRPMSGSRLSCSPRSPRGERVPPVPRATRQPAAFPMSGKAMRTKLARRMPRGNDTQLCADPHNGTGDDHIPSHDVLTTCSLDTCYKVTSSPGIRLDARLEVCVLQTRRPLVSTMISWRWCPGECTKARGVRGSHTLCSPIADSKWLKIDDILSLKHARDSLDPTHPPDAGSLHKG